MKKKLILILSMVVLCVSLFAIGVSADSFTVNNLEVVTYDLPSYFVDPYLAEIEPMIMFKNDGYFEAPMVNGYTFYYNDGSYSEYIDYIEFSYYTINNSPCYCYNFKILKAYLETKDVVDFSSFNVWRKQLEVNGPLEDLLVNTIDEELYNELFTFEDNPTYSEADLTAKYNEGYNEGYTLGKTDGVNEFKESDDYTGALLAEYTSGHADGYNAYKESNEYQSALETQYKLGSSTGVKNFIESEEYSNALQAEYDNGFEAATAEQEQEGAINILTTVLGISGALVLILLGVYFFMGKKGKKRR